MPVPDSPQTHHHHHHHHAPEELARISQWRIGVAIGLGLVTIVAQVVVGILSGSLALLSDSAHVFTDVFGLTTALIAVRIGATKAATSSHTFGYRRVEVLAAGINALLLLVVAIVIVKEAIARLMEPVNVHGGPVALVAFIGLLMNLIAFLVMRGGKDDSINIKGAYMEVMADMVGSIGVLISGLITLITGWVYADIVVAVLIAIWVLPRAFILLRQVINVMLQATPEEVDCEQLRADIAAVDGVEEVHHFHVWSLTTGDNIGSVHVVSDKETTLATVKNIMEQKYHLNHVTVQVEPPHAACTIEGNCGSK